MDYASATPPDTRVAALIARVSRKYADNPGAIHHGGVEAKKILESAREKVAALLGARADEIIFTSGATESNNLAILGAVEAARRHAAAVHIVTTNIEHASVLEACRHLEKSGRAKVTYVPAGPDGIVDPKKIRQALCRDTALVSVMYANNEIGTIQPVAEIAKVIRHHNKNNSGKAVFHTDAAQAANYLPLEISKLGVDMQTINGGKIYGPKGSGALFVRKGVSIEPIFYGGSQENKLRPGTEDVARAAGLALALEIAQKIREKESTRLSKLRDYFFKKLSALDRGIILNGDPKRRLPNNVNISVPKIPGDLLVIELSERGIMASAKSACKSGDGKASHVIRAIRPDAPEIDGSLRFSLGRATTKLHVDLAVRSLKDIFTKLGGWYN
jgi:cysteine desulfurase